MQIHDVHNAGSGIFHITYHSASTSNEELIHNVYNAGDGKIHIKYWNSAASAASVRRKMVNDIRNAGSGDVFITYRYCDPSTSSVPRNTNISGKLVNDVYLQGSGSVYITYLNCCASNSSVTSNTDLCGELVNNVYKYGSGNIYCEYWISNDDTSCQEILCMRRRYDAVAATSVRSADLEKGECRSKDVQAVKGGFEEIKGEVERKIEEVEDKVQEKISEVEKKFCKLEDKPNNFPASPEVINFRPTVKPLIFEGQTSWTVVKTQFDVVSFTNGWTDFLKVSQLVACLRRSAAEVLQGIPVDKLTDLSTIERALEYRFGDSHLTQFYRIELKRTETKRKPSGIFRRCGATNEPGLR
ncbi:hypothetical protein AVEN_197424-1 [Araneus ventricosus]|uniref:Uncharacterized protein n=1 Tax=Araneus ventricosus TaxID=182803 RepID=A0A4Y2IDC2_ARAVE|nr:hypothetical protein AVEN_197424-1 [Araneus ventricosus]